MLIRDDITFKHGKCLKNERIIALYSLLLISLQKQQNQIISMINYFLLRLKDSIFCLHYTVNQTNDYMGQPAVALNQIYWIYLSGE